MISVHDIILRSDNRLSTFKDTLSVSVVEEGDVENETEAPTTSKQVALLITSFDAPLSLGTIPIPDLNDHEILVKNKAVGLNPIDWKAKKYRFGVYSFPWINGRENSGIVIKKGSRVAANISEADNVVISSTSYRDNRTSTFQEYTAIDSRLVWKLPDFLTHQDGATLGVGLVTASVIIYDSFKFPLTSTPITDPNVNNDPQTLLIWGGGTVVGIYLTQLAKLIGLQVVSIASIDHIEYLSSLGAHTIIDRYLPTDEIAQRLPDRIDFAVDCISKETSQVVFDLVSAKTHITKFAGIVGIPKIVPASVQVEGVVIKKFHEDIDFGSKVVAVTSDYLNSRRLAPARFKLYEGTLDSINHGLQDLEVVGAKTEKCVISLT